MGLLVARHEMIHGPVCEGVCNLPEHQAKYGVTQNPHLPYHCCRNTCLPLSNNQLGSHHGLTKEGGL
jgi:hypothetical protein